VLSTPPLMPTTTRFLLGIAEILRFGGKGWVTLDVLEIVIS
jgi:hypothetical protein